MVVKKPAPRLSKGHLVLASASLILFLGFAPAVFAGEMETNLSKLERHFFHHDYPKSESTERLERIEKLMFGEAKTGSDEERLKTILSLLPDLAKEEPVPSRTASASPPARNPGGTREGPTAGSSRPRQPVPLEDEEDGPKPGGSSYPAVTAIERKVLGRDYTEESVGKRLDRLEMKAFGKTSSAADLQERVDKLKSSTGIDMAKTPPPGSDWADDDDEPQFAYAPPRSSQPQLQPYSGLGEDGKSFSGRDLRKDLYNAFGRKPYKDEYAGTGTFGAGKTSPPVARDADSPSSRGGAAGMPPMAPDMVRRGGSPHPAPLGLQQQVALLEREVFQKSYTSETIPARLNRLEATVFPKDKPAADKSLPDRVSRLLAAVPISETPPVAPKRKKGDMDFDDMMDLSDIPTAQAPRSGGGGGLSKIINGLGSMLTGGMVGGYSTTPGNLITDPQTGLLWDQYTGTLIDPLTGAVVGRKTVQYPSGYGTGYGGFNSGFSPMSPYGMGGSGMRFGFGSGGVGLGNGFWP